MLAETWKIMKQDRLRSSAEVEAMLPGWKRLAGNSLVAAGLNSPELLGPLFKHVGGAELMVVRQDANLLLAMPVQRRKFPRGLLGSWITPLTPSGTPHIDAGAPATALATLLDGLQVPLMLNAIEANGALWDYISTRNAHFEVIDRWQRAGLKLEGGHAKWLETNFNAKRRKEYKRLAARLGETGNFEQQEFAAGDNVQSWINALLDVEQAGWKGQRGTALASHPKLEIATREGLEALAQSGKLRMWRLTLDQRTIAIMHGVVEGERVWLGKIAYDESLAKFSPGVLLILFATERLFADGRLKLADSCAIPNHPMIDNIWRDRIEVADVMIAPRSISAAHFRFLLQLERLRRTTRAMARDTYNYFRGRHRS